MTWAKLLADKRIAAEPTTKQEIDELWALVARNLTDAGVAGLSADGRYGFAYSALRTLATLVVRACGYRVKSQSAGHYYTFLALEAANAGFAGYAAIGDAARRKRNDFSYDSTGIVNDTEVDDLLKEVHQFHKDVEAWITKHHPPLV